MTYYAQTTIEVTVNDQRYNLTYRDNVDFNTYQTTIDDQVWWALVQNPVDWVNAAYSTDNNLTSLRFAYNEDTFGGTEYNFYRDRSGLDNTASTNTGQYAINAVQVPAPFPILGILPVAGFLRRMRRRQKAS